MILRKERHTGLANSEPQLPWKQPLRYGRPAPGNEAVGCIPGIRSRRLRTEDRIFHTVIHHRVGARRRSRITREPLELPAEGSPHREFQGLVYIVPGVLQAIESAIREQACSH